ncbi:hypothetical protein QCN29_32465 [Streptomyces sp. HNM0663]|uniref:Uncharacterized protein n=1 Tax=Streptomyces chengmaiensis TaxID=3040919 RepID=A0ABT6HXG3_9ACTN|nr:hypothetical protein [Streptomyces chengmaiensis]MDH2393397.1 hypothetical protein [Streptomyces chengmaiensis]
MTQTPAKQQAHPTHPWPDNVTARYANLTGATVDVLTDNTDVRAVCTGCPAAEQTYPLRAPGTHTGYELRPALASAQSWAQDHAERCRALPRPA